MLSFDYDTSILNPALKLIVALIYIGVVYMYYKASKEYEGALNHNMLVLLLWMSIFGFLGALVRYFGHGTQFGFTKAYSLKWFQSLFYIVQASLFIVAGYKLFKTSKK